MRFQALSAAVLMALAGFMFSGDTLAQWRKHAHWCAKEAEGTSKRSYLNVCAQRDQYDAVIACQSEGNPGHAKKEIEEAGRDQVNAYMATIGPPSTCKGFGGGGVVSAPPPSPPATVESMTVIARFWCEADGEETGTTIDVTSTGTTCQNAFNKLNQASSAQNYCNRNYGSRYSVSRYAWVHEGPCKGMFK